MFYQNEHFIAKLDQSYKVWSPTTCGGSVPLAPMALRDKKALHGLLFIVLWSFKYWVGCSGF